jgi:hypothetical protein
VKGGSLVASLATRQRWKPHARLGGERGECVTSEVLARESVASAGVATLMDEYSGQA